MGPRWLVADEGEAELVGYSLDLMKDGFVERTRQGLMARLPQNDPTGETTAPPDALAAMGRDRRVIRGLNESDASYARRLVAWLDDRKTAGNPYALMKKLSEYTGEGPFFRTVDNRGNWYERAANGTQAVLLNQGNWDWDGDTGRWSRFWVIVFPQGLWTEGPIGPVDGKWGNPNAPHWGDPGTTWGTTATPEEVQTVRAIVADWKPAGTRCANIIIAFDPLQFDPTNPSYSGGRFPDGLWGRWGKTVDGVRVPARLESARYWDGV